MYSVGLATLKWLWKKTPWARKKEIQKVLNSLIEELFAVKAVIVLIEEDTWSTVLFEASSDWQPSVKQMWKGRELDEYCKQLLYKTLDTPNTPIILRRNQLQKGLMTLLAEEIGMKMIRVSYLSSNPELSKVKLIYVGFAEEHISNSEKLGCEQAIGELRELV